MRGAQHAFAVDEHHHRQAIDPEVAAGVLGGGDQQRELHVLGTREFLGARRLSSRLTPMTVRPALRIGLRDAVERLELGAAGVAAAAPEANYHDFAAVLGDAHVLAGEAARHQVGRRLCRRSSYFSAAPAGGAAKSQRAAQRKRSKTRAG